MIVIKRANQIVDNKAFVTLDQARNYVAMNFRRNWRNYENHQSIVKSLLSQHRAIDMMECANYGTRFYFVEVELQKHE